MVKTVYVLLTLFLCAGGALAEGISVSQSRNKASVAFTDSVEFEIVLQWDGPQTDYFFNKPLNPNIEGMKVSRFASSIESSTSAGKEITTKKYLYVLQPIISGVGRIEPVEISFVSWPDSVPGQLFTEAMSFEIAPPQAVELTMPSYTWLYIVLGILLAGTLALVVAAIFKKPRSEVSTTKTPREDFLDSLASTRTAAGSDLKKFQTEVYKILAAFLKRQYNIDAVDLPEDQLVGKLESAGLAHDKSKKICAWLLRAQKDKYSPSGSSPGEAVRLESELREFFEKM